GPGLPLPPSPATAAVSTLGPGLLPAPAHPVTPPSLIFGGYGVLTIPTSGPSGVVTSTSKPVGIATGPLAGPLRTRTFSSAVRGIAANAAGDIAVVIEPCATRVSGCHPAAPALLLARRGHSFGKPIPITSTKGHAYGAAVAIDPRGRVLVAWDREGSVYARFASTTGRFTPIQRLGPEHGRSTFQAVLPGDGRAAVGWTSQNVSEGDATSPFTASVSLAGPSRHFARARVLETVQRTGTGRYVPYQGLVVRLPTGQPGLVAWTGYSGAHYVVRAASIVGTSVAAPETVSTPAVDTVLADAAEGTRGQAIVLILPGRAGADPPIGSQPAGLAGVTRPTSGQPFGPPEQIVPAPEFIDGAAVGIDPASGAAFATWRDVGAPIGWSIRTSLG
ncbi:MAG: hypothetical protein QOE27_629, partial [Solirubrobacteraceae bacterium]|nr:hypothetical protein [Solirubrobacteraceae bacterium]